MTHEVATEIIVAGEAVLVTDAADDVVKAINASNRSLVAFTRAGNGCPLHVNPTLVSKVRPTHHES